MQVQQSERINSNISAPSLSLCAFTRQWLADQVANRILSAIGLINTAKIDYAIAAENIVHKPDNVEYRSHYEFSQKRLAYLKKCHHQPPCFDEHKLHTMLANVLCPKIVERIYYQSSGSKSVTCVNRLQTILANALWPIIPQCVNDQPPNNEVFSYRVTFGTEPSQELQEIATRVGLTQSCQVLQQAYPLFPKDYTVNLQLFVNHNAERKFVLTQKSQGVVFSTETLTVPKAAL